MKPNIKAYFIDLDGTLVDQGKKISQQNQQAIQSALSQNKAIIISTGRNMNEKNIKLLSNLNVESISFLNGSIILHKGQIIQDLSIDLKHIPFFANYAIKNKLTIALSHKKSAKIFWIHRFSSSKKILKKINKTIENGLKIYKISLFSFDKEKISSSFQELKSLNNMDLSFVTSYGGKIIEITNISADKGQAARKIMSLINASASESMHIGDSLNDAPALKALDHLVAMASGDKNLFKYASWIGPYYKKGGVAKVILENDFYKNDKKI